MAALLLPPGAQKPLIMMCGNYGTGKTAAAEFLQKHLGFELVSFDDVQRKSGRRYRGKHAGQVLARMDELVKEALGENRGIIVDRPHTTYSSRQRTYGPAHEHSSQILLIECTCPDEVAELRIAQRPSSFWRHLPTNNPLRRELVKSAWEGVSRDFELDSLLHTFVTHIIYDTHEVRAAIERATEPLRAFAEDVRRMLDAFHP